MIRKVWEKARDMFQALLPWPSRNERIAAIQAARHEKEHSKNLAAHAKKVEDQIQKIAKENHFADSIAQQLMRRRTQNDQ
jgi:hypothetical protein